MGHDSGKLQFISAAILLGLLTSLFAMPLTGANEIPTSVGITRGNQEAPNTAAFDLDANYFYRYLDSVLYRLYNFSRDTNTEYGRDGTYFHVLSTDWSTLVDNNKDKYSLDNILFYLGPWAMKLPSQVYTGAFSQLYSEIVSSPLYRHFNSTTGAFRVKMNQNGTSVNETFRMEDNALAIYAMLPFVSRAVQEATPLAKEIWNYLNNTLWHPDSILENNYFRVQNGTDPAETQTFQNLLGAFVNSRVAGTIGDLATPAADIAQRSFAAVNKTGVFIGFGGYSTNQNFREAAGATEISRLRTNALGVAALADFYLRSGRAEANKSSLTQAEVLYRTICDNFYNSSFSDGGAFMDDLTDTAKGRSIQTTLESNAYWLLALARLFEASGNITYYEKGIDVYNQVIANLWDTQNLGFNTSRGFYSNDTTKNVGYQSLFYVAVQQLIQSYWQTTFTITSPPPDQVVHVNPVLNLTCQYNVSWVRGSYNINQSIAGANVSFSLRYDNGTFITQIQNYTNVNGTFNLLYQLPADLPLGTYWIHAYANRTGFGTAYAFEQFSIISNISLSSVDPAIHVIQGETVKYNFTFSSTRNNASWVIFNGTSDGLNSSAKTFLLSNNTSSSQELNFTADVDALVNFHDVTLTLINDSITFFTTSITIEVLPAVTFESIQFPKKIVSGFNGEMYITLKNARPSTQEVVNLTLWGEDVQAITQSLTIQGQERVKVYVPLQYTGSFNTGSLNFEINISRYSQIIASNTYTSELVPGIYVQGVSTSTAVVQGRNFYINFQATNNMNETQLVKLYINGQLAQANIALSPGENRIIVPRTPLTINPWDFATYILNVTVQDDNKVLFQQRLLVQAIPSVENVLFFYILPIMVPIAAVLIFIQRQKKRELLR